MLFVCGSHKLFVSMYSYPVIYSSAMPPLLVRVAGAAAPQGLAATHHDLAQSPKWFQAKSSIVQSIVFGLSNWHFPLYF